MKIESKIFICANFVKTDIFVLNRVILAAVFSSCLSLLNQEQVLKTSM